MLDTHINTDPNWGIRPILFSVLGFKVESYSFFILLSLVAGGLVYYHEAKSKKQDNEPTFYIALAGLIGGTIGAKIIIWLTNYRLIISSFPDYSLFLSGRSIVGGFIGGSISILLVKKYLKIKGKRGNYFAPAVSLGMAIGRIGCFLRGCCFGQATNLPMGVNFGDHLRRHPTQLYEATFWLVTFLVIQKYKSRVVVPGQLFKMMLIAYFIFRFFLEYIKDEPAKLWGFTIYQIVILMYFLFTTRKIISVILKKVIIITKAMLN